MALIACLSSSCQFLGLDMYPPELQRASTSCDLPALVMEKTGATFKKVQTMRQITAGSLTALFVICDTDSSNVLVILDPESLACLGCITGASTPIGASIEDHFCIGNRDIQNDGTWTASSTIDSTVDSTSYRFILPLKAKTTNVLSKTEGGKLYIEEATSASSVWLSTGTASAWIDSSHSTNWDLTDMAPGSSVTRLLLRNNSTGAISCVEYAGSPDSLYSNLGTYSTSLLFSVKPAFHFYANSQEAWLLNDCVVNVKNDNNKKYVIRQRYKDGIEIDSHLIDSNWKDSIYFEPTGERWYYYDTRVSKLCVLRTWW